MKRVRTEKIVTAAAALTVTACAAYVVHKKLKERCDGIIKAGESLQRIEMRDTGGKLHDVFYMSKGKHDNKRYSGILGMTRHKQTGKAFMMKMEASNDIKVASKDRAIKIFEELYKNDSGFRSIVEPRVGGNLLGGNEVDTSKLTKRNIKKMYENFNSDLVNLHETGVATKFYDKLKSAGYGAIQDINDMKFSGYNAKNPLIVFDNSKGNIMVKSVTEMSSATVNINGKKELVKSAGEQVVKDIFGKYGLATSAIVTGTAVSKYVEDPEEQLYRQGKK